MGDNEQPRLSPPAAQNSMRPLCTDLLLLRVFGFCARVVARPETSILRRSIKLPPVFLIFCFVGLVRGEMCFLEV